MSFAVASPLVQRSLPDWDQVRAACHQSNVGKRLPDALYVHHSGLAQLDPLLHSIVETARSLLDSDSETSETHLIKFHLTQPQLSFLCYPNFDGDPHPALDFSLQVNLYTGQVQRRDYGKTLNPPILHRKETFVLPDYPHFSTFAHLTQQEEKLGLLKQSRHIGTRLNWQQRLRDHGLEIHDHALACPLRMENQALSLPKPQIDRHKAAIRRTALSKPVRLAMEAGLLPEGTIFFDYGCGHGEDVERLVKLGYGAEGWDPYYQPDTPWMQGEVVNLGYIINVIEEPGERREALLQAWGLTRKVLIVSAQVLVEDPTQGWLAYGDGVITSRNTFQKYYEQEELKAYIEQVLGVDAVPIALGIYLVFRDNAQAEAFRASRFRSRAKTPTVRSKVSRFEEFQAVLQPLMDFYSDRGRLPTAEEVAERESLQAITAQFSMKQAFNLILKATNPLEWDAIRDQRCQDWLVHLALSQFGRRPRFSELDSATQRDLKGLFGNYKEACVAADLMLMSVGNLERIRETCQRSKLGLQCKHSLWIHCDLLESLEALLRLYEGCGARTFGRPEGATIVRLHWKQAAITYYTPENFDRDPHPILLNAMKIDLKSARVYYQEYDRPSPLMETSRAANPPILVCKDRLVSPDYPHYNKFAKLTQQEYQWGILEDTELLHRGWNLREWQQRVSDRGASFKGHRLVWRKDLDPYQRKLLESQQRYFS